MPAAPASASVDRSVKKIVLAVHGIGDQSRNETALSTTIRFCDHFEYPGMVPLGAFYGALENGKPALFVPNPPERDGLSGTMGFAEVYWAGIAREADDDKYTLQETKAWARSVVNRVRVLAADRDSENTSIDYPRIRLVLEEMIETINVVESLLFLARKAGVLEFDLKKILDAFLGDVQLVADFEPIREKIVGKFLSVLTAVEGLYPEAEIYIVSHSEGTVVSFLGLLEGCSDSTKHPWIHRVRGFMTLGSPIDKHLILWPGIFEKFKGPGASTPPEPELPIVEATVAPGRPGFVKFPVKLGHVKPTGLSAEDLVKAWVPQLETFKKFLPKTRQPATPSIRWVNYVDYSDPVGFELDTAREWLKQRGYGRVFRFSARMDYAFRRYPVPGKAHVDYWGDPEVFGHFIRTVVAPDRTLSLAKKKQLIKKGPPSLWWVPLVSYGLGYLLPLVVIHLGVFVLFKTIYGFLDPKDELLHPDFYWTVIGVSWLVAGTMVWLRLVKLTRGWWWFFLGLAIYSTFAAGYIWLVGRLDNNPELEWLEAPALAHKWPLGVASFAASLALILVVLVLNSNFWRRRSS